MSLIEKPLQFEGCNKFFSERIRPVLKMRNIPAWCAHIFYLDGGNFVLSCTKRPPPPFFETTKNQSPKPWAIEQQKCRPDLFHYRWIPWQLTFSGINEDLGQKRRRKKPTLKVMIALFQPSARREHQFYLNESNVLPFHIERPPTQRTNPQNRGHRLTKIPPRSIPLWMNSVTTNWRPLEMEMGFLHRYDTVLTAHAGRL